MTTSRQIPEVAAAVQHREHLDRVGPHAINQPVGLFDELSDIRAPELRHGAPGLRMLERLAQAAHDPIDDLLRVDRRGEPNVLGNSAELAGRVIRPAEPTRHGRACCDRLRGAADPRAYPRQSVVVFDEPARVRLEEPSLDRLPDVDLVGEVVPGGRLGEAVEETLRLRLDALALAHGSKVRAEGSRPQV